MNFSCARCGACCRWEGYVRLLSWEPDRIAAYLGLELEIFLQQYTRLTADRQGLSLTEKPDGSCIFLEPDSRCRIQAVKPAQCQSFPLAWSFPGAENLCPGIRP